jgi:sugar phosphate isomerase/epimerase
MLHIDWVPWIPTLIALALALVLLGLVCDVLGMARRLTPASHAFFAPFPPLARRAWRVLVMVLLAQLVLTVASVTVLSQSWSELMFRVWETDVLPLAIAMGLAVVVGHVGGMRARRRRQRDTDTAIEIGRGLGRLAAKAARTPQGKQALRHASRVADSVKAASQPPPKRGS